MITQYDSCDISAILQVEKIEVDPSEWNEYTEFSVTLIIQENTECGIDYPITVTLKNQHGDNLIWNLLRVCLVYSVVSVLTTFATKS